MEVWVVLKDNGDYAYDREGNLRAFVKKESAERSMYRLPKHEMRMASGQMVYAKVKYQVTRFSRG